MNDMTPVITLADLLAMPVHPLAAKFPLLADDELQALADDIAENGQRHPILYGPVVTDAEAEPPTVVDMILDGRNRLLACERTEMQPLSQRFEGTEAQIAALIMSENVARRNLTAGQRAMARAILTKPLPGKRTDLNPTSPQLRGGDVHEDSVRRARFVLNNEPAMADSVLNGAISLNAAFEQAKGRVEEVDEEEADRQQEEVERRAALDALRQRYPDLARRVEDENDDLDLDGATDQADELDRQARNQRATIFRAVKQAIEGLFVLSGETESVAALIKKHPAEFEEINALGWEHIADCADRASDGMRILKPVFATLRKEAKT